MQIIIARVSSLDLKLILMHILITPLRILIVIIIRTMILTMICIMILIMIRSDLSSIGSVEQVTVMDSTFAAISAIPSPALVKHQKYLDTAGSHPHLDRFPPV